MDTHRFIVGQNVRLVQSVLHRGKSIPCEVVQVMPYDGACFQYRVRSTDENFDRIAKEHELAETTVSDEPGQPRHSVSLPIFTSIAIKGKR